MNLLTIRDLALRPQPLADFSHRRPAQQAPLPLATRSIFGAPISMMSFRQLCRQRGRTLTLEEWHRYLGNQSWRPTCDCWETPPDVVEAGLWPPKDRELNCPRPY